MVSAARFMSLSERRRGLLGRPRLTYLPEDGELRIENVLLVCNVAQADSVTVRNAYRTQRRYFRYAGVLNVDLTTTGSGGFEKISLANLSSQLLDPLETKLAACPDVTHVVLLYGCPTRVAEGTTSVQGRIRSDVEQIEYSTHLDLGSLTNTLAYIAKLATVHALVGSRGLIISGRVGGVAGEQYYFDDNRAVQYAASEAVLDQYEDALAAPPTHTPLIETIVNYVIDGATPITALVNPAGYCGWGANSGGAVAEDYATDGTIVVSGDHCGWWAITTIESFNGQRADPNQGCFSEWFSETAWGGTDYAHTPVTALGYVEEPSLFGVIASTFFGDWERGVYAAKAWGDAINQGQAFLNAGFATMFGDPFVSLHMRVITPGPYSVQIAQAFVPGAVVTQAFVPGAVISQAVSQ